MLCWSGVWRNDEYISGAPFIPRQLLLCRISRDSFCDSLLCETTINRRLVVWTLLINTVSESSVVLYSCCERITRGFELIEARLRRAWIIAKFIGYYYYASSCSELRLKRASCSELIHMKLSLVMVIAVEMVFQMETENSFLWILVITILLGFEKGFNQRYLPEIMKRF